MVWVIFPVWPRVQDLDWVLTQWKWCGRNGWVTCMSLFAPTWGSPESSEPSNPCGLTQVGPSSPGKGSVRGGTASLLLHHNCSPPKLVVWYNERTRQKMGFSAEFPMVEDYQTWFLVCQHRHRCTDPSHRTPMITLTHRIDTQSWDSRAQNSWFSELSPTRQKKATSSPLKDLISYIWLRDSQDVFYLCQWEKTAFSPSIAMTRHFLPDDNACRRHSNCRQDASFRAQTWGTSAVFCSVNVRSCLAIASVRNRYVKQPCENAARTS